MSKARDIADLDTAELAGGAGSGLDADTLDGQQGAFYTAYADTAVSTTNVVAALTAAGDVAFGTKFFWDASAESLGIGTTSPAAKFHASQTYSAPTNGISADTVGIFSKSNTASGNANVSVLARSSGTASLYLGDESDENKWAISSLSSNTGLTFNYAGTERNTSDDGVVVAHWRASDVDGEHSGSSYGTCSFTPDSTAEGYTAYADITEAQAIGWVKDDMGEDAVTALEASIAAQIEESKAPAVAVGVPW